MKRGVNRIHIDTEKVIIIKSHALTALVKTKYSGQVAHFLCQMPVVVD